MKNIFLSALMTCAFIAPSFANEQQAADLFSKRGEDKAYAEQSAKLYAQLAQDESDVLKRATYKTKEAEATYFVGTKVTDRDLKMETFDKGQKAAMVAVGLLSSSPGVARDTAFKTELARAYYFYGANLGKWGEAKGVLAALGRWPELKENMMHVVANDESVEDYGVYRILGRAYMKVPFESSAQGLEFLRKAYENTQVSVAGMSLSRNSTTIAYFLDILKKQEEVSTFCDVYGKFSKLVKFSDADLLKYNPVKLPETKTDLADFAVNKDLQKYAQSECN